MATTETRQRLNIAVPKDLIEELRARVPSRHRTAFVVQALARELHRLRLLEAIDATAGAWRAEDHPELTSPETVAEWVKEQRSQRHWPPPIETPRDG